jgi:hypothetical protein
LVSNSSGLPTRAFSTHGISEKLCVRAHEIPALELDAVAGTFNVKLIDEGLAERKTKWRPRETNLTPGAF